MSMNNISESVFYSPSMGQALISCDPGKLRYNIVENTKAKMVLVFFIPGFYQEQLKVIVRGNVLYLSGHMSESDCRVSCNNDFSLAIASNANLLLNSYSYENGILTVYISKNSYDY